MWNKIKGYVGKYLDIAKNRINDMQSPITILP